MAASAAVFEASCAEPQRHRVDPERKSLIIAAARVRHDQNGPEVRIEVETTSGLGIDLADVRSIMLYRVMLDGVNPMRDHTRAILAPPLGWSCDDMAEIARTNGPASPRQVLVDRDVAPGRTYAYRVAYSMGPLRTETSPLTAVAIHPPDAWWPTERAASEIAALSTAWPAELRVTTIGAGAHKGLPITALHAGSADPEAPTLVLIGGIHAGESGPELIVNALGKLLTRSRSDATLEAALDRAAIFAVPILNVDERDRLLSGHPTYLRLSPQGIDLNRNFPAWWEEVSNSYGTTNTEPGSWTYRGAAPLAAVEARTLHDALGDVHVAALMSYHWLYSLSGPQLEQPQPPVLAKAPAELRERQAALATTWFRGLGKQPYPVKVKNPVLDTSPGGSLVTWAFATRGAPAFEIEAAGDPRLEALATSPPTRELLDEYSERHADAIEAVMRWIVGG